MLQRRDRLRDKAYRRRLHTWNILVNVMKLDGKHTLTYSHACPNSAIRSSSQKGSTIIRLTRTACWMACITSWQKVLADKNCHLSFKQTFHGALLIGLAALATAWKIYLFMQIVDLKPDVLGWTQTFSRPFRQVCPSIQNLFGPLGVDHLNCVTSVIFCKTDVAICRISAFGLSIWRMRVARSLRHSYSSCRISRCDETIEQMKLRLAGLSRSADASRSTGSKSAQLVSSQWCHCLRWKMGWILGFWWACIFL